MSTYQLSIITPDGRVFDASVVSLTAPGREGSLGVLAHHAPMVTLLKKGVISIQTEGDKANIAIASGTLEVNSKGNVLILADEAEELKTV